MKAFTTLALESAKTRKQALLDLHIHTFSCVYCPDFLKEENCVSDGQYCAFFPRVGELSQEIIDPEDYEMDNQPKGDQLVDSDTIADFTGRELLISSLHEKCYHQELKSIIARGKEDKYDLEKTFID